MVEQIATCLRCRNSYKHFDKLEWLL